jgi:predicted nucleic acid-binding Zn ribbon protein
VSGEQTDPGRAGGDDLEVGPPGVDNADGAAPRDVPDLGRSALAAARSAARRRGNQGQAGGRRGGTGRRRGGYSGSGADDRDPQRFGALTDRLVRDRGWEQPVTDAAVLARWEAVVGREVASHCQPESLRDGELVLAAESTAWATQLRLLVPTLMTKIRNDLGAGVVTRIRVHGPTAPTWRKGPLRVNGRGPRDTYG